MEHGFHYWKSFLHTELVRKSLISMVILLCYTTVPGALAQTPLQCGTDGFVTFEKIAGVSLRGDAILPILYSAEAQDTTPITAKCNNKCRASETCQAYILHYDQRTCYVLDVSQHTVPPIVTGVGRASFFKKICLTGPVCSRAWTFERVMGRELDGFDDRLLNEVPSRLHCQELCLREKTFLCRSGEYDSKRKTCHLSAEDRRTQPSAFTFSTDNVDYFENQCVSANVGSSCDYEKHQDMDLGQPDLLRTAFSSEQCRSLCDATRAFYCRSFTYEPATAQCWLSSDDTTSTGPRALAHKQGSLFFQKANCMPDEMKLACTPDAMTVTLNTHEPFMGRMFARSDSPDCEAVGNGKNTMQLTLPMKLPKCGMKEEEDGRFTNIIVIQHHPIIQRKGDRAVRVTCYFGTGNKTITNTMRVMVGDSVAATSIVNATAPTPNIRLSITDKNGQDVTGAKLGDELYLRIEMDGDSVFGIFARDLIARSGTTSEHITLIDGHGCPTDPNIFPPLEKVPGTKALQSRFDAFKFSGDVVVRFQVNVQFCLQECPPAICPQNVTSYGRRRRGLTANENEGAHSRPIQTAADLPTTPSTNSSLMPILPDYPLQREIIVEGISVKRVSDAQEAEMEDTSDIVCTSRTALVAAVIAAGILQLCIISTCITCLSVKRKPIPIKMHDLHSPAPSQSNFYYGHPENLDYLRTLD